ncbi:MAG: Serine/threonine-protein kinase Nek2 [Thelocarpon impressellum]|nr:MAG: Serine/threonine-protein kinase Nek2 [Thelocarpon impressellum]
MVQRRWALREIHNVRRLHHRNIICYVDGFYDRRVSCTASLYTEHCDLGSLEDLLATHSKKRSPVGEPFVRHVFSSLLEGLAYMHAGLSTTLGRGKRDRSPGWHTMLHRDLKPGNIFLMSSRDVFPRVVIGDLGNAISDSDPDFHVPVFAGAPCIMPPEAPIFSEEGDIWAVGAVLQMMCRLDGGPLRHNPRGWDGLGWLQKMDHYALLGPGPEYSRGVRDPAHLALSRLQHLRPNACELAGVLRRSLARYPVAFKALPSWAVPEGVR